MKVSYNKLWKLLIDRDMKKGDLQRETGISTSVIAKLSKGRSVTTDILLRICEVMECDFAEIMEVDRSGSDMNNPEKEEKNDNREKAANNNSFEQQIWKVADTLHNNTET